MEAYREDLAYIHDVGFGAFAREAAPAVLEILRARGHAGGLVVDLGCGSGIWAGALVEAGYEVLGVDLSAAMLAIARDRVPEATFAEASFAEVAIPRCEAVTALGEVLGYRCDWRQGAGALDRLFGRIHAALRPDGVLVFDLAGPGRRGGGAWQGEGWAVLVEVEEDGRRRILRRRITSFREVGKHWRRDREEHELRLHDPAEVCARLRRVGFRVRVVRGWGARRLPPSVAGFVARKP